MPERLRFARSISVAFFAMLVLTGAVAVLAQSGRRSKTPPAVPAATPEPVPTRTKSTETEKKTLSLIVGVDRYSDVSDIPLSFYGSVVISCADRLDDAKSVKVDATFKSMSRSDAAKRARGEQEAYVVSLELRSLNTRVGFQTTRDLNDVFIDYAVFAPATGKVLASGKAYQRVESLGGVIVKQPSGRNTIADHEYWLKQAARTVAEKILAALRIQVPSGPLALGE
jgi:hypothetical protein